MIRQGCEPLIYVSLLHCAGSRSFVNCISQVLTVQFSRYPSLGFTVCWCCCQSCRHEDTKPGSADYSEPVLAGFRVAMSVVGLLATAVSSPLISRWGPWKIGRLFSAVQLIAVWLAVACLVVIPKLQVMQVTSELCISKRHCCTCTVCPLKHQMYCTAHYCRFLVCTPSYFSVSYRERGCGLLTCAIHRFHTHLSMMWLCCCEWSLDTWCQCKLVQSGLVGVIFADHARRCWRGREGCDQCVPRSGTPRPTSTYLCSCNLFASNLVA